MNNSKLIYGLGLIALAIAVFFLAARVKGRFHFGGDTHWGDAHITAVDSINISGIQSLHAQGSSNITIIPADDERVVFYYDKADIENLSELKDSILYIDFKGEGTRAFSFRKSKPIMVKVYTRNINQIEQEGIGSIKTEGVLAQDYIRLNNQGIGSMEFEIQSKNIEIINGGVGSITLEGSAENAEIKNEGTGSIEAENLIVKNVKASNQGIGSISLYALETLDLSNQGIGSIEYSGEGKLMRKVSQGIGSINKK